MKPGEIGLAINTGPCERVIGICFNGPLTMPCGGTYDPRGKVLQDVPCTHSGGCPQGHKACWFIKVEP